MVFHSILFETSEDRISTEPPEFFGDLNLDSVVETITVYKREYHLEPFFYTSLITVDAIDYRHEVMQDFENEGAAYKSVR